MTQEFLRKLLDKPQSYLLAWAYIYANADEDGTFVGNARLLQSRLKISRPTLHRIIQYGLEWTASGQQVDRKWTDNELIISNLKQVCGQKVDSKWTASGQLTAQKDDQKQAQKEPEKQEPLPPAEEDLSESYEPVIEEKKKRAKSDKLYPKMVEEYDQFCQRQVGMGAKMNAQQGKAMKSIVEYLKLQVINKIGAEDADKVQENILLSWKYILTNWKSIKGYYHDQIKLSQIDSNLPVILMHLKQAKSTKRDEQYANTANEINRTSFE